MTFWAHRHHSDEAQSSAVPWPAAALNFLMRLGFHRTRRPIADAERSAAENPPVENSLKLMIWLNCAVADAEARITGRRDQAYLRTFLKSRRIDPDAKPQVFGLVERLRWAAYEAGRLEGESAPSAGRGSPTLGTSPRRVWERAISAARGLAVRRPAKEIRRRQ